jgi:hypothetical protein
MVTTNQTGPPVRGDDFFDREKFLPELWLRINDGETFSCSHRGEWASHQ